MAQWYTAAVLSLQAMVVVLASVSTVHLDAGALDERLVAALSVEMPAARLVADADAAELRIHVRRTTDALTLRIADRDGLILLSRAVPLDDGLDPALRVVVLLAAQTAADRAGWADVQTEAPPAVAAPIESEPDADSADSDPEPLPDPPVVPIPEAPAASVWTATAAGALLGWQRPATPQLGAAVAISFSPDEAGALALGGRVAVLGLFCCDLSTDAITASARETLVILEARTRLLRAGRLEADVLAGAGSAWLSLEAAPALFEGDVVPVRVSVAQAVALASASARFRIAGPVHLRGEAGGLLRLNAQRVRLPPAFSDVDDPVQSGRLVPWALFGVDVTIF